MVQNFWKDKDGRYPIKTTTIETVDQAVVDYFDKKLKLQVDGGKERSKVKVIFATGERWKLIRDNKGIRDENGTLILPILAIRRTEIERTPGFGGMMQEVPSITIANRTHRKTSLHQNLTEKRRKAGFFQEKKKDPVIETITLPFPDFATIYYQIVIWTQYRSQMNEVLQKIFYNYDHMDSFVMPVDYDGNEPLGNSYYFVGFREGTLTEDSNVEEFTGQERIIKYTYSIKTPIYLMMDPKDEALKYGIRGGTREEGGGENIVYKKQNVIDVKLKETIGTLEELEKILG